MKIFRRINSFFDRLSHDIRLFNARTALLCGLITVTIGIFSWIIGGRADKVILLYIFPRSALSLGTMYFLWLLSFLFVGLIAGGVAFGCEKYKRREVYKILLFLCISYLFTLCVYPIFFKSLSPFITFIVILVSVMFCFLSLLASLKIYSLWSMFLLLHMLWLIYNGYISLSIAIVN